MRIRRIVTGCIAGLFLFLMMTLRAPAAYGAEGPVVIDGPAALIAFGDSVSAGQTYAGRTVVLAGDVDMTGWGFVPIGQTMTGDWSRVFQGTLDGGGHAIKGLTVSGAGLFSALYGATVHDLRLEITVSAQGQTAAGGLAGRMVSTTLQNVAVDGYVTAGSWAAPEDGILAAGVLAGRAEGWTVMDRCAARGSLGAAGAFGASVYAGGAVGYLQGAAVSNSYSTAGVYGNDAGITAGGFAGLIADSQIADSYAASAMVTGINTAGAFAGTASGTFLSNVWHDGELTAPLPAVGGGTFGGAALGAPTAEMQSAPFPARLSGAFYQAAPGQNNGYPVLDFEAMPLPTAEPIPTTEPSSAPTETPIPTAEPSPVPTETPTPIVEPSPVPTETPIPTAEPSPLPTESPVPPVTSAPFGPTAPTSVPTAQPSWPTGQSGGPTGPSWPSTPTAPRTGDGAAWAGWLALLLALTAALAALVWRHRR